MSKQLQYTLAEVMAIKKKAKDEGYKKGWNGAFKYMKQLKKF